MIQCITHQNNMKEAANMIEHADVEHVTWLVERLLRQFRDTPTGCLTANALSAYTSFGAGYRKNGLEGALIHSKWLISSLHKIPVNDDNNEVMQTAEALAYALGLEW